MPGIDPKEWGPSAWWLLHTAAAKAARGGTSKDLTMFKTMAASLDCLLPCDTCRENFKRHLKSNNWPRAATSLPGWVYKLHSNVKADIPSPKRSSVLPVYAQPCNINADHDALVSKAAPFLANLEPNCVALRDFAEGLHYFFGAPAVTDQALKTATSFKRWLGVTAQHVKMCKGTCTQKGGCGGL